MFAKEGKLFQKIEESLSNYNVLRSRSSSERKSIVCNIKPDTTKLNIIKKEINDKDYETGWSEEYQDESRIENSMMHDQEQFGNVIQMADEEHDEESK